MCDVVLSVCLCVFWCESVRLKFNAFVLLCKNYCAMLYDLLSFVCLRMFACVFLCVRVFVCDVLRALYGCL